ncbi:MAG: hypothetical protein GC152_08885 [Alphaproteobacteria bacterium]|nr:hypothetical protein [Alphaproteobacteria bacterium]
MTVSYARATGSGLTNAGLTASSGQRLSVATARRIAIALVAAVSLAAALFMTQGDAAMKIAAADPDLARLLKAMTAIKAVLALGVTAAVGLRAGAPMGARWSVAYAGAVAAMWAGVGTMWRLQFTGVAAIAMHVGLFGAIILFFRDPAVERALAKALFRKTARRL